MRTLLCVPRRFTTFFLFSLCFPKLYRLSCLLFIIVVPSSHITVQNGSLQIGYNKPLRHYIREKERISTSACASLASHCNRHPYSIWGGGGRFQFFFSFWQPKTFCVFVVELLWARVQNDRRRGPSALLLFCCVVRRVYKAVPAGT